MATLQASSLLHLTSPAPRLCKKTTFMAAFNIPKSGTRRNSYIPNVPISSGLVEDFKFGTNFTDLMISGINIVENQNGFPRKENNDGRIHLVMEKLYAISEAVADRVEMHKNIGEQRENWNSLLLTSINGIILAAATMCATAATTSHVVVNAAPMAMASLKLSSTLLYLAATAMLIIMNKIQPSQLVEEQRNAARLFQQLHNHIERIITIGNPNDGDVKEAMDKVLALDRAYPLPLLGAMLEKFPSTMEPAVWWPQEGRRQLGKSGLGEKRDWNGWNGKLEEEMRNIVEVVRTKDEAEYLRLGRKALKMNKLMAISGPVLTGLATLGSAFVGSPFQGCWAVMLGVVGGALASVVNTFEHGGQVGMVFEMYRSNAGFFKLMDEFIQSNLMERQVERRENGELLEIKVALQLGRSLSELRDLSSSSSSSSSSQGEDVHEFASKLF